MRHIPHVLVLGLAAASCAGPAQQGEAAAARPASASEGQTSASETAAADKEGKDKTLVCEFESVTGSNIPQRVCRYKKDKDKRRIEDQEAVRRIRPAGSPNTR